ncbi:MAG TPA: long-chain fatty acid--CoA ligase, partial [Candidatus Atribacteria bacterium]|nr:long-chain fatty acid--CoA ligase [Candidatus Atribacteria bacterium]
MSQQTLKTLNEMLRNSVRLYGDRTAFKVKKEGKFVPITYKEFYNRVEKFGTGLLKIGIEKFDHIGLVSDNRFEWIIADMAIIGLRAVDVPCSGDSSPHDIYFKLHHSDAKAAILEGEKQFSKFFSLAKDLPQIKNIILLDRIKMFSEKEDAPEWAIPIGFEEDGKVSKKLYNELCSLIKNNNKYIFLSKEAKDYLDKYLEKNTNKLLKETHSTETTDSVKNKLLRKTVIINKNFNETHHYKIYYFPRIIQIGEELLAKGDTQFDEISKSGQPDDLTTIIYTSGTTA